MKIEATVQSLGREGDGLVEQDNQKYYIPYTVPGDKIEFEVIKEKKRERLHLHQILSPSLDRIAPTCSHFGDCGGCKLQHISQELYLDFKKRQLTHALDFYQVIPKEIRPLHLIPQHKRRRISLTFAHRYEGLLLGYVRRHSKQIVDVKECFLIRTEIESFLPSLRAMLKDLFVQRESGYVDIIASQTGLDVNIKTGYLKSLTVEQSELLSAFALKNDLARLSLNYRPILTLRDPVVSFKGVEVIVEAGKFLQASDEADDFMLSCLQSYIPQNIKRSADLFAGRGTFTFLLALYGDVDAFECEQDAIKAMEKAAQKTKAPIQVVRRDLFGFPLRADELNLYDFVVVDPPRTGALSQVQEIGLSGLSDVVYISCNPASFARDAQILTHAGFTLTSVTGLDQFLWSEHLEVIGQFSR